MYVWHYPILKYLHNILSSGKLLGRAVPRDLAAGIPEVALIFVVTLVVSWLQFRFVERPIMRHWSEPAAVRAQRARERQARKAAAAEQST
jgi:peptidoglycan/LPS O-acetylase OafA/YrhL